MARLTLRDFTRLLDVLRDCYGVRDLDEFRRSVVMSIPRLVPCETPAYNEVDLRKKTLRYVWNPDTVLEVGDTFSLSGAIGPTLPAVVSYIITAPSGQQLAFSHRANRIGYYYRPEHDVVVSEPGLWTVDLRVTYDGLTPAGQVTPPFPSGDVLGTADGRFVFYVVPRDSAPLAVKA